MEKPAWLTPALFVALIAGGLGGAVFTWWVHREPPLRIGYEMTRTSTGADVTTNGLVQGLTLRIGSRDIPAIHTHVITLSPDTGYADTVDVGITFDKPVEIFGRSAEAPSPVHSISCESISQGIRCKLGPLDGRGAYKIALATNLPDEPRLSVAGRNISLDTMQQIAADRNSFRNPFTFIGYLGVLFCVLAGGFFMHKLDRRAEARRNTLEYQEAKLKWVQKRVDELKAREKRSNQS